MSKKTMSAAEIAALPYRPCVGLVVVNRRGEVFAGKRIDNPGDAWQMPQGGVDPGETPAEAAIRELGEETGLRDDEVAIVGEMEDWISYDLPQDLVPKIWKGRYRGQEQKWFLIRFAGDDADISIDTKHAEFSSWRWMTPEELIDRIVPFKRQTYEQVFAAFSGRIAPF